ncbi:MAG: hypothetical protein LBB82_03455 [Treponema sp.]|jgi:hypothetical protein|nr:hypothetical protein [Treponema sp.]
MTKRPCKYGALLLLILIFCAAAAAGAQETGWRVFSVRGDVKLTRTGGRTPSRGAMEGSLLGVGDMLQTVSGEAELQIENGLPAGDGSYGVIYLGENTTLIIGALAPSAALELVYGRLRVVLGSEAPPSLSLKAGNSTITAVGDFAVDYQMRRGGVQPVLSVYCFRGEGELIPVRQEEIPDLAKLSLREGEVLALEYHTPFSYVERRVIDGETLNYWAAHDFSGTAPLLMPETGLGVKVSSANAGRTAANVLPPPEASPNRKRKIAYAVTGVAFAAAGGAMFAFSRLGDDYLGKNGRDYMRHGSFGAFALGAIFLTGALFTR